MVIGELIGPELDRYTAAKDRLQRTVDYNVSYWRERAAQGKANEAFINQFNMFCTHIVQHMEATEKLISTIAWASNIVGVNELPKLKKQVRSLIEENERLTACLKSTGFDMSLIPYVRPSDYSYA